MGAKKHGKLGWGQTEAVNEEKLTEGEKKGKRGEEKGEEIVVVGWEQQREVVMDEKKQEVGVTRGAVSIIII